LRAAGIPTPRILASSEDAALDGRPFILMEKMRGLRVEDAIEEASARTLVASAFAAIRAVHAVGHDRSGIGDEPVTDLEAEVARWQRLASRGPADLVRDIGRLQSELLRARPAERVPALVHGDYHLGNVLFESGRVVGILDWEIAELGQSPLDEAALCMVAIREAFKEPNPGREAALPLHEMMELADGGPDFDWYLAATCHKYAAIFGYNLDLHRRGRRHDPLYEQLTQTIPGLVDAGLALLA
jgi:aminoglycoside phosphotransferase (APT) family kinase protein